MACRLGDLRPDRTGPDGDRTVTVKIGVRPVVAGSYTNRAVASHANPGALGIGVPDAPDASDAASSGVEAAGK